MITAQAGAQMQIYATIRVISGGPAVSITLSAQMSGTLPNFQISTTERQLRGPPGADAPTGADMDFLAMYLLTRG